MESVVATNLKLSSIYGPNVAKEMLSKQAYSLQNMRIVGDMDYANDPITKFTVTAINAMSDKLDRPLMRLPKINIAAIATILKELPTFGIQRAFSPSEDNAAKTFSIAHGKVAPQFS